MLSDDPFEFSDCYLAAAIAVDPLAHLGRVHGDLLYFSPMTTITTGEIQRDLLGFLRRIKAGELLIIVDADKPVAEVRPLASVPRALRPFALCAGDFEVPEDFDDPLPDEVLELFEG